MHSVFFFERFGDDAGFLTVLLLQICGRVRGSESDQERGAPVLGENRRNAGGFGWLVLWGDVSASDPIALFCCMSWVVLVSIAGEV